MARYLTISDLESNVGPTRARQYFDDDLSGSLDEESSELDDVLTAAENEADSELLRSFSVAEITDLVDNDSALKRHVAWIALHFATERRPEFMAADGSGAHKDQYERAMRYCRNLGKGTNRSAGEEEVGRGGRHGGRVQPTVSSTDPKFIFAPCKNAPTGHGGF